jgi:DNA (cytosine-5)-methyltransferase 1
MKTFTFSDCFAGIGGLRLAGEAAGGRCVFSSEVDGACREVHETNHGESPSGDLALVDPRMVPRHDLCLASPPCTPFSQSGHQGGFADERADVLYTLFRFLGGCRPRAVLVENAPGMAGNDGGRTLRFVLRTLRGLGYRASWAVVPATRFGGCQLRRRLYVVGSVGRRFRFGQLPRLPTGRMADILEPNPADAWWLRPDEYVLLDNPVARRSGMVFVGYRRKPMWHPARDVRNPSNHRQQNRIYAAEGVGPTISSQDSTGRYWVRLAGGVRKLTRVEMSRMQGLPDTFRWVRPERMVSQVGNSVHVPTVAAIVRGIADQLL